MDTLSPDRYIAHSDIPDDTTIWRYMDLAKLMSMIAGDTLWFPALWTFEDPYEGVLSLPFLRRRMMGLKLPHEASVENRTKYFNLAYLLGVKGLRATSFVSCWNVSVGESVALWRIYSQDSVAIQSTIGRVQDAIAYQGESPLESGLVSYKDDPENEDSDTSWPQAVLTKGRAYKYEDEFRFFFTDAGSMGAVFDKVTSRAGIPVPIDPELLISRIVVSPNQPVWFTPLLRDLLIMFELDPDLVQPSELSRKPFYRQGA